MRTAQRILIRPWRDPRLVLGVMLVLIATLVGAKVYTVRDNTVAYWSVGSTVTSGDPVTAADLVPARARLSGAVAASYLLASDTLPARIADLVWARDVPAGSLLERSAMVEATAQHAIELPLNVANGSYPTGIRRGDHVDVWAGPAAGQPMADDAIRVLSGVRVASVGGDDFAKSGASSRTIMVSVPDADLTARAMSSISARHVTLVRLP